eukprot:sb/3478920/
MSPCDFRVGLSNQGQKPSQLSVVREQQPNTAVQLPKQSHQRIRSVVLSWGYRPRTVSVEFYPMVYLRTWVSLSAFHFSALWGGHIIISTCSINSFTL